MEPQLHQLRSFVTVAEELHFGRAALRLGLSQPQVSRHVRALESALGVELFVRTARRTTLTEAGEALLDDARDTLAAADRLQARAQVDGSDHGGRVGAGFVWSTLVAYLPPLVAEAATRWPHIELAVRQLRFVEVVPALRRGDVDLVLTRRLHEDSEMVEVLLRREATMIALPEGHPLASLNVVPVPALDGVDVVMLERSVAPAAVDAIGALVRKRGLEWRVAQVARSPTEALALVAAGIGVYRVPESAAPAYRGVVYRPLEGSGTRLIAMRRPEPPPPTVATILELAVELFGDDARGASNDGRASLEAGAMRH